MEMRTNYDFSPLFRSSIGFDHLFDMLESAARVQPLDNWPPYDIEKTGEGRYRLSVAVAGFSADDLDITKQQNMLIVSGRKGDKPREAEQQYQGIASRSFERRFQLADYVEVAEANVVNGLLTIDLVREVPDAMKPKRIPLQTRTALPASQDAAKEEMKQAA
jgi:molecular chaperone IbpA